MPRPQSVTPYAQKMNTMRQQLMKGRDEIAKILPKHLNADEMLRFALTAAVKTPKLFECSLESVGLAIMQAGSLGVRPNGYEAHLVPFGPVCTLIVDFKGLVKLAYNSPGVVRVSAKAIRANDDFEYQDGTDGFVRHKVPMDVEDDETERGPLIGAWAMIGWKDGGYNFIVLNKAQVLKRKKASRASDKPDSPWQLWPDEMWAKTAIKQLSKFAPLSAEFQRASDWDNRVEMGDRITSRELSTQFSPDVRIPFDDEPSQDASGGDETDDASGTSSTAPRTSGAKSGQLFDSVAAELEEQIKAAASDAEMKAARKAVSQARVRDDITADECEALQKLAQDIKDEMGG